MQSPTWNVIFSSDNAGAHAWGSRRTDHFLSLKACLYLVVGSDRAVYMVIVPTDDARDVLIFDFGQFWFDASLYRTTEHVVTYHTGRSGLILGLESASDMERFERACDHVLPTYKAGSVPPTLEQLGELGVLSVPRRVGDFLHGDPVTDGAPPSAPQEEPIVNEGEDEPGVDFDRVISGLGAYLISLVDEMDTEEVEEDEDVEITFEELSAMISEAAEAIMLSTSPYLH
ncbi:hypothetical protein OH76DRAFT_1413375 [Lentinus brumalis]|uniref:Uncharacterized protein n=1 Tax=Lentinus brumalis TaxID=2498619 RepID=A0A371CHL0_9APHY|nr:hypothetical protein OH76DRAFT_1413375 [Polyporus brumalis]